MLGQAARAMPRAPRKEVRARLRAGLLLAGVVLAAFGYLQSTRNAGAVKCADSQLAFFGSQMRNVSQIVKEAFPGAMKGQAVMSKVLRAIRPHGVRQGNTIYGQSICSDEINGDKGHFPALMGKFYGKVFPLGGIGGAPYVGKTGFMAFSHHVPDDGNVVVVFGPHIGFTMDGKAGRFLREGQAAISTACGAVIAAYGQCLSGSMRGDPQDAQQSWLRAKLKQHTSAVTSSDNPMVELVMKAYEAVEEEVLAIVNTDFGPGNLVLVGGIQINMPYPMNGFWMPLHFSIRSQDMEPVDLMENFP